MIINRVRLEKMRGAYDYDAMSVQWAFGYG